MASALLPNFREDDRRFSCPGNTYDRSEEHTSELQSQSNLVCRLLLEKKKKHKQVADREVLGEEAHEPQQRRRFRNWSPSGAIRPSNPHRSVRSACCALFAVHDTPVRR